jgi:protein-S-isoprenylcysteine O-methyltransferase Ste14
MNDKLIYAFHAIFWVTFAVRRLAGAPAPRADAPSVPEAAPARTAPFSRGLLLLHNFGFFLLYFGVNAVVFSMPRPVSITRWSSYQDLVGAAIIVLGGAIAAWAMLVFRSWRLCAQLDAGHELATTGPFALVRHPIYLSLDLLALGTVAWLTTPIVAAGTAICVAASVLRARAEERLLLEAFGEAYRDYRKRVAGFIPFII